MKKKKDRAGEWTALIFFMILGGIIGGLIAAKLEMRGMAKKSVAENLSLLGVLFGGGFFAIYFHIIVHEAGHLIFGLLSGYKFASFRVGNIMLLSENGKFRIKKLHIVGTEGQCLMIPPKWSEENFPTVLYNLGGIINNFLFAVLFYGLFIVYKDDKILSSFFLIMAIVGVIGAILNGLPIPMGGVDNDGRNVFSLRKNKAAKRAFHSILMLNYYMLQGKRLKDISEEIIWLPAKEMRTNALVTSVFILYCEKLLDEGKFEEANEKMKECMEEESGMTPFQKWSVTCERIFLEIIAGRFEEAEALLTVKQKKFMSRMKNYLPFIRVEYAYQLLVKNDKKAAEEKKRQFEKVKRTFPYSGEIEAEMERMKLIEDRVLNIVSKTC